MKTKLTALLLFLSLYSFGQELAKPKKDRAFKSVVTTTKNERLSPKGKKFVVFGSPDPYIGFRIVKLNENQFYLRLEGGHDNGGLIIEKGDKATIRFMDNTELILNAERRYAVHPSQLRSNRNVQQLEWANDYLINTDAIAVLKVKEIKDIAVSGSRTFEYKVDEANKTLITKTLPVIGL